MLLCVKGSPAMDEATLREEVIAEMDFTEAQVKKVQAMQMQETGRTFFLPCRHRGRLASSIPSCFLSCLVVSVVWM